MAEKETAVAVVRSNALSGTIDEKMRGFDQIAANIASLQLNGWDTVPKAKAGCWLADGVGEHPAVFMQNHWVMLIKGRLTIEPKWEYMIRKLKDTVPGFRFKVLIETDDCAKVWMTDGKDEHTVEYTLNDAKRQGLLGRGENAWTTGSTREMCLKQAVKRAARRIGVGQTPWVDVEDLALVDGTAPTTAEVLDAAIGKVADPVGERSGAGGDSTPASRESAASGTPQPEKLPEVSGPHARLAAMLAKQYGKLSKSVALEKAAFLYNQMQKERTGVDPQARWTKAQQIGPVEAGQIADYLAEIMAKKAAPSIPEADVVDEDEPPPPEIEEQEAYEAEPEEPENTPGDAFMALVSTVERARKLFAPRQFIQEAPPGTGKLWYTDQTTFLQAGHKTSVKLKVGPDVVADVAQIAQLNAILTEAVDEKERGGR